ncbi:Superoxide dismutase-like copper/zinc binding [Gracilaria domingensis]|nr:Superoxide dismutase-like copper/zinc binding [Gracilaria domingensis]
MSTLSGFNSFITVALAFCFLNSVARAEPVTAAAIIHEEDGTWGSVVFHQWTRTTPVVISMLFQNLKLQGMVPVNYQIWDEPVHYNWYSREERCGTKALKAIMSVNGSWVGDLGMRHRLMTSHRFAEVVYDKKLSLYKDEHHSIIGKTFVIQQGAGESSYSCATILASKLHSQRPGAIPCEVKEYSDCVVGSNEDGKCTLRSCYGYRQYWGLIDENTQMCAQSREVYPKRLGGTSSAEGVFPCKYGNHTLLRPIDRKDHLL